MLVLQLVEGDLWLQFRLRATCAVKAGCAGFYVDGVMVAVWRLREKTLSGYVGDSMAFVRAGSCMPELGFMFRHLVADAAIDQHASCVLKDQEAPRWTLEGHQEPQSTEKQHLQKLLFSKAKTILSESWRLPRRA